MENKDYVSLEVARLLKEKGFNEYTFLFYNSSEKCIEDCTSKNIRYRQVNNYILSPVKDDVAIPHLYDTQKYLREKYKINIIIEDTGDSMRYTYTINDMLNQYSHEGICESLEYNSYEECLNKAIEIVLTKMI